MKTPLLLAALALAPLASCASSGGGERAAESGAVRFGSIARGEQSGLAEAQRSVIRTEPAWKAAWTRINAYRMPAPPAPGIDFEREMVLLVALGEQPSAGHAVEVVSVERQGGFLRVRARVTRPAAGSAQAAVLTHPYHAVRVPRSDGPVEITLE